MINWKHYKSTWNGSRWFIFFRLFLGTVFLYACMEKILHPHDFAQSIYNYQILPSPIINLAALLLPWLELLLGICLITNIYLPAALLWSNMLLWIFFVALLYNYFRGLNVHCGCFSAPMDQNEAAPMAWYVIRDLFFLSAGGYLMFSIFIQTRNSPGKIDGKPVDRSTLKK